MTFCACKHPALHHNLGGACSAEGCGCAKFVEAGAAESVTIPPELEKFARGLIGQCQQTILKQRRIIDDIKRQYGLTE